MAELVYSAGLTSKLFWLQESRKTAGYILDGYSKADIRKIAWEENIQTADYFLSFYMKCTTKRFDQVKKKSQTGI